jgi:two-component system OmpR family sensor kinase
MRFASSLQGQTFAVVALLVLVLSGSGFVLLARLFADYTLTMTEVLNASLAAHVAEQLRGTPGDGGDLKARSPNLFTHLMSVNPNVEIYLLDREGYIVSFSAPAEKIKRRHVDLQPLRAVVSNQFVFPVFADDPRDAAARKIFSAALIDPANPDAGFVFIILGGADYDAAGRRIQGDILLRGGLALAAIGLFAGFAAMGLARWRIVDRLRRVTQEMARFEASGYREPPALSAARSGRGDEIDAAAIFFGDMASHIEMLVVRLEATDHARRDMIFNVAHDLRTPIASARAHLESLVMKGAAFDAARRDDHTRIALREMDRLTHFADELFELGKLEQPVEAAEMELVSLAEVVQDVSQKLQPAARARGVVLNAELGEGMPFARANVALIERALDNLIENALQHTPEGGRIDLAIRRANGSAAIIVSDTGAGVAPEHQSRLFDRFYRVPGGASSRGGAGLGLAIVKRIAELHGGRVAVESGPGEGARFTFELPAES